MPYYYKQYKNSIYFELAFQISSASAWLCARFFFRINQRTLINAHILKLSPYYFCMSWKTINLIRKCQFRFNLCSTYARFWAISANISSDGRKVWLISVGNPSVKLRRYYRYRKSMLSSTWNMRWGAFPFFLFLLFFSVFSSLCSHISSFMHSSHGDLDWRAETPPEGRNVVDGDERKSMLLPESGSPFLPYFLQPLALPSFPSTSFSPTWSSLSLIRAFWIYQRCDVDRRRFILRNRNRNRWEISAGAILVK